MPEYKKNKDGYYRTSVSLKDLHGDARRIFLRAKSPDELFEMVTRTKMQIERGEICFNSNTPFSRWAEEWLTVYKAGISQKNYNTYEANLRLHINPVIGRLSLCDIRPLHCKKVLNLQSGKSKSHVSKLRMTMYQIFEQAIENEYLVRNPARKLSLPEVTNGTHGAITDFEREKVLSLCETHRAGLWILTMLYCGLRPSEAIDLNWSDVDLDDGFIAVEHSITGDVKTDSALRRVPVPTPLLKRLRDEKDRTKTTFIFHQLKNPMKPHTDTSMRSMWENFKRELDISMGATVYRNQIVMSVVAKDLTPYCFRHTCATDYQAAGVPLNVAKVLLGHKDVQVTANIYTHYSNTDERSAAEALQKYWG